MSDDLIALQEADALLKEHSDALYVGCGVYRYLPSDPITTAAFSALCGARRHIERLTIAHVTGTKREKMPNGTQV